MRGQNLYRRSTMLALWVTLMITGASLAEIPRIITFQGKLTGADGKLVDEARTLTFRLYHSLSGGTALWEEIHTDTPVTKGIFAVPLGVTTPLPSNFNTNYWVSIQVEGEAAEMAPRHQLSASPYALNAERANTATEAGHAAEADHATTATTVTTSPIPSGVIVMWSGLIANIPDGWALCNGLNGTPDLRDRFVVGARQDDAGAAKTNVKGSLMQTGGESAHVLTTAEMASHTHGIQYHPYQAMTARPVAWYPPIANPNSSGSSSWQGWDTTVYRMTDTGGNKPHENCPPFYALAYIMKL